MSREKLHRLRLPALVMGAALCSPVLALTGIQIGPSGKTYASGDIQCALHPLTGMAPVVQAGLYNPKKSASGTVSLNNAPLATVTFLNPDTYVWLVNDTNKVLVALDKKNVDTYAFDASSSQTNVCIPDTSGNAVIGDLEYAASNKSYATVAPGCALNASTGRSQPYVNLFDNGAYLLNVSANNVPLTQLNGTTRTHTPVFLSAGQNVISAANGSVSTDYFVRDGGNGTCLLP